MRKEWIICIIIIVIIIIANIFTQKYTKEAVEIMDNKLSELKKEITKEDENMNEQVLEQKMEEVMNKWKEKYKVLAFFIEHDELEKVEAEITSLKAHIEAEEYKECRAELEKAIFILEHIKEKFKLSIKNIF